VILRCTGKMLSLLYPAAQCSVAPVAAHENDWYANLLWIDRRKCLLITHAGTLFSALAPDLRVADVRPIGRFIVPLIEHELRVEGLRVDTFGKLEPDDVVVTKTADRSVLGCMNDMALMCESLVTVSGGLQQCDVAVLNHGLRRHISSSRGYVPPIELAARQAESSPP